MTCRLKQPGVFHHSLQSFTSFHQVETSLVLCISIDLQYKLYWQLDDSCLISDTNSAPVQNVVSISEHYYPANPFKGVLTKCYEIPHGAPFTDID